jgi:hypothetical protein
LPTAILQEDGVSMSSLLAIHLRVNVTTRKVQDASGRVWGPTEMPIYRAEGIIHRLTCVYTDPDDGTEKPFPFTASMTFKFGVKDPASITGATFLVYSDNASFNLSADWAQVDPTQGKICYRFSSNTADMTSFLSAATVDGKEARAEVEVTEAGDLPFALFQNGMQCYQDVIRGSEGDPTPAEPTYPTSDELNGRLGQGLQFKRVGNRVLVMIDGVESGSFEKPS